jgi:hypothetical protein
LKGDEVRYVKSVFVGIVTAGVTVTGYILVSGVNIVQRLESDYFEVVVWQFKVGPILLLLVLVTFAGGFFWELKRISRRVR